MAQEYQSGLVVIVIATTIWTTPTTPTLARNLSREVMTNDILGQMEMRKV